MTCSDVQSVLPDLMEGGTNAEFQAHLKACPDCAQLVSELDLIAGDARQLAATEEPPERLWVKIAAELRAEGVIREPEAVSARPVPEIRRRWSAWWLVPVATALLAGAAYFVNRPPTAQVANQTSPAVSPAPQAAVSQPPKAAEKPVQVAAAKAPKTSETKAPAVSVPGALVDDSSFIRGVAQRAPGMRVTFESQLQAVNAYIRDAEAYLQQNPDDMDARQQLMDAYEQKAMLYQMALDHVQ